MPCDSKGRHRDHNGNVGEPPTGKFIDAFFFGYEKLGSQLGGNDASGVRSASAAVSPRILAWAAWSSGSAGRGRAFATHGTGGKSPWMHVLHMDDDESRRTTVHMLKCPRGMSTPPTEAPSMNPCVGAWSFADGACFKYVASPTKTFDDAAADCGALYAGASLATITSQAQNDLAATLVGSSPNARIGLHWSAGALRWLSGATVTYQASWHEQPNGQGSQ
eukprot:gene2307-biopygen21504